MIVERLESRELDGEIERRALFTWGDGEAEVTLALPAELAGESDDASPFLPLALLPAMRRGEDLAVDGPVSPRLVRGVGRAKELYRAWCPPLHDSAVEVAEERPCPPRSEQLGCFFSRGLDSTFSAVVPRSHPGTVERLVYISGIQTGHDDAVRAEERRRAVAAAERIGLPLTVVRVSFWHAVLPVVGDADDIIGPALAMVALSLGGGLGRLLVPPSNSTLTLGPQGSHPALDPLFSSEAVAIEYDNVAEGRIGKTIRLARERPELLADLKVCFVSNRPDNCGRCQKCLLAMGALEAVGALHAAEQFPDEIDLDAIRVLDMQNLQRRVEWSELVAKLDPHRHGALRRCVLDALEPPGGSFPGEPRAQTPDFRGRHYNTLVGALRYGRPDPPPEDLATPAGYGLVRALDHARGMHVYGVGTLPAGVVAGELGSLPRDRARDATEALWLTDGGYLLKEGHAVPDRRASGPRRLRWTLAPLAWRDAGGPAARTRAALWRLGRLVRPRDRATRRLAPVGYVYDRHRPGRIELHSAFHPVTGDQLLTTNPWEANDLGYGPAELMGYIDAAAPVTGRLGTKRLRLPWASRFGRRFRDPSGRHWVA